MDAQQRFEVHALLAHISLVSSNSSVGSRNRASGGRYSLPNASESHRLTRRDVVSRLVASTPSSEDGI
jgi:hypothetical protein